MAYRVNICSRGTQVRPLQVTTPYLVLLFRSQHCSTQRHKHFTYNDKCKPEHSYLRYLLYPYWYLLEQQQVYITWRGQCLTWDMWGVCGLIRPRIIPHVSFCFYILWHCFMQIRMESSSWVRHLKWSILCLTFARNGGSFHANKFAFIHQSQAPRILHASLPPSLRVPPPLGLESCIFQ